MSIFNILKSHFRWSHHLQHQLPQLAQKLWTLRFVVLFVSHFSTIFIANPLKQEFVVNRCHHYQVLARINKNSALSVSLSRPQWKYCVQKIKRNIIKVLLFSLRLISRNVTHHPHIIMHQHPHTKFLWRDHILPFCICSWNISE